MVERRTVSGRTPADKRMGEAYHRNAHFASAIEPAKRVACRMRQVARGERVCLMQGEFQPLRFCKARQQNTLYALYQNESNATPIA